MSSERFCEHRLLTAPFEDPNRRAHDSLRFDDITLGEQRARTRFVNLSCGANVLKFLEQLPSPIPPGRYRTNLLTANAMCSSKVRCWRHS